MSVPNQPNGKKSSSSSLANTPSSTPVASSNGNTAVTVIHNSPPPNNNAPKYGTLVPNRIFVGGISANTTEGELLQLFSTYGTVKAAKIIQDRAGVSKGYGFITFESEDDAQRPLREADNIVLRERKLNIAPAVKKQPFNFNRAFDGNSPTVTVGNPSFFLPPIPYYQNSMSYYGPPAPNPPVPGDPNAQQQVYQPPPPVYSAQTGPPQAATFPQVMYPQPFYIQQQYPLMPYADYTYFSNNGAPAQYVVGAQGGPGPQAPPLPPSGSPPRPPCFNQQVAYTNEPMYYNVSMYPPMDHPAAVFQEPIEANGNYSERPNSVQSAIAIDVMYNSQAGPEYVERGRLLLPAPSPFDAAATRFPTTTPPFINQPPPSAPKQPQRETEEAVRQTTTPEVSLLSIDNSCERDLNSMQGGRRRPALPAVAAIPPSSAYHPIPNGLPPLSVSLANTSVPPPSHYRYQPPPFCSHVPVRPFNGQSSHFASNGRQQQLVRSAQAHNSWPRRQQQRKNYTSRQHQQNNNISTRSSVRTESTSSLASFIEENHRNNHRTNVNTPPPAPYSPLTNHGYAPRFNGTTTPPVDSVPARQNRNYNNHNGQYDNRRFYNNRNNNNKQNGSNYRTNNVRQNGHNGFVNNNNRRSAYRQTEVTNNGHQNNRYRPEANRTAALPDNGHRVETNESDSSDRVDNKPESNKIDETNAPQVHGASGTSSYAQLPIRRSKRSIRRSNAGAGNALSEIGAGDAPLAPQTPEAVAEACKKLEGLKL